MTISQKVQFWSEDTVITRTDEIAQEVAIALVYNGISHVVMMASPFDLSDLALGFSLSEGIIKHTREIHDICITHQPLGIEVNIEIASGPMSALKLQRRNMTGRTGCGLCGAESLQQAVRPLAKMDVSKAPRINHKAIQTAVINLNKHQPLQQITGAVHGAAWCDLQGNILKIKEDVGRHNALDKLIGAMYDQAKSGKESSNTLPVDLSQGFALISSRASYEMVTKASRAGITLLVAVSAPTALAINLAKQANLTLVGFARNGRHTIYT
ncbi:MAG: formate dehydrogenase accessory sulfurtransferase FdhD [Alteromonadaceae bacterium]|nr:formate dehydrogenase accessory sulfurtransferase FdhD [Alteromonadaceae bacterium]